MSSISRSVVMMTRGWVLLSTSGVGTTVEPPLSGAGFVPSSGAVELPPGMRSC